MTLLTDLEDVVVSGRTLDAVELARVAACPDLAVVGALGERARRRLHGSRVTFLRVLELHPGTSATDPGLAGEVRLAGAPATVDEACERVREAAALAGPVPVTGFSLTALMQLAGGDHLALAELARALRQAGLAGVAEVPADELGAGEAIVEAVRAVRHGGLEARRATVSRACFDVRRELIATVEAVQQATGAFQAFAPLPRHDPADQPSTGYDDVRTVALARLGTSIPSIQVDWPRYGPKLAQVALTYGADDIDGIAAVDAPEAGRRRSAREEIVRHIRMAFADPVERDGWFNARP